MQPSQPYYQPPNQTNNQYDFIFQNDVPKRNFGGNNKPKTLLIVIGAAVAVIGLLIIILSLAFRGNGGDTAPFVAIAQQQAEMIRISTPAAKDDILSRQSSKNLAHNALSVLTSDQKNLLDTLAKSGTKVNKKTLAAKQNSTLDEALEAAKASGTYDSTYVDSMQASLEAYQTSLQQAYQKSHAKIMRELLAKQYDNATLLLEQSKQN